MPEVPSILRHIIDAPAAWCSPSAIATAAGAEVDEVGDQLCELHLSGWIDTWERPDGLVVTLSAWGAEQLGARLVAVEVLGVEHTRWRPVGDPDPDPPRAQGVMASEEAAAFDQVVDPKPGPAAIAEARDELVKQIRIHKRGVKESPLARMVITGGLPWPLIVLGSNRLCWSELLLGADPRLCPDCAGRPLSPVEYCLGCDRWGFNWLRADDSRFNAKGALAPRKQRKRQQDPEHVRNLEKIRRRREKELRRAKRRERRAS